MKKLLNSGLKLLCWQFCQIYVRNFNAETNKGHMHFCETNLQTEITKRHLLYFQESLSEVHP